MIERHLSAAMIGDIPELISALPMDIEAIAVSVYIAYLILFYDVINVCIMGNCVGVEML